MKQKTADAISGLTIRTTAGLALLLGLTFVGPTKRGCEVYQGFTKVDNEIVYVFDPKPKNERGLDSKYPLVGEDSLRNSMIRGKKYCFEYKKPLAPWAPKELVGTPQLADESRER